MQARQDISRGGPIRRIGSALLAAVIGVSGMVGIELATAPGAGAAPIALSLERASVGPDGEQITNGSCSNYDGLWSAKDCAPAISADGQHVAFVTRGSLVPEDSNFGQEDVYVRDLVSGETHLVSRGETGLQPYSAADPSISATGRYVTFTALGSILPGIAGSDGCDGVEVYVRDRDTDGDGILDEPGATATRLVSATGTLGSTESVPADGCTTGRSSISSTGRFVAFESDAPSFGGPQIEGSYFNVVWLRDRDADANGVFDEPGGVSTTWVSRGGGGSVLTSTTSCGYLAYGSAVRACGPRVSDDGRFVAFSTVSGINAADTNARPDVAIWDRNTGTSTAAARNAGLATFAGGSFGAMSANGRFVTIASDDASLPSATGTSRVYRRDRDGNNNGVYDEAADGGFTLMSNAVPTSWAGAPDVANDGTVSYINDIDFPLMTGYVRFTDGTSLTVKDSGGTDARVRTVMIAQARPTVVFTSPDPLIAADTNTFAGAEDVYVTRFGNALTGVTVSLAASTLNTPPGATSVAINAIPTDALRGFGLDVSTAPGGTKLRPGGTKLRPGGTKLRPGGTRLRPGGTRLRDVASTLVSSLATRLGTVDAVRDAPLSQIGVTTDGGWPALLAGTPLDGIPIQSVSVGALLDLYTAQAASPALADLTVGDLVLDDSPLIAITPVGFELGNTPVSDLTAAPFVPWCTQFASVTGRTCAEFGADGTGRTLMELDMIPDAALLLAEHPELRQIDVGRNFFTLQLQSAPVLDTLLDDLNLYVTRLGASALDGAVRTASALRAVPLDDFTDAELAVFAVCSASFTCPGADLGAAVDAGAIRPTATLADLGKHFKDPALGPLALSDLGSIVLYGITVNDVVTGYLDAIDFPWEELDLEAAGLARFADPVTTVDYTTTFQAQATGTIAGLDARVLVRMPAGFRLDPTVRSGLAPLRVTGTGTPTVRVLDEQVSEDATLLIVGVSGVTSNTNYSVVARVIPSLGLGAGQVSARVEVETVGTDATPLEVRVVEGTDPGSNAGTAASIASDRLQFGYLADGGDVDLYSFSPRSVDTQVGVRLSHLAGDGDLVLFGPPQDTPTSGISPVASRAIAPQVAPIDDEGIDPTSNQVAPRPELSADVPVGAPAGTTVVARSATSSVVDEENAIGRGANFVQVSAYRGAVSNLPYVLRVREVAATAVPQCLPYDHPFSGAPGTLPDLTTVPADVRTVFLVNLQRLGDQFPGADVSALLAKVATLAADPSVRGVVLPVEGSSPARNAGYPDVAGAYAALAAKPCDPTLTNTVVRRISELVQGLRNGSLPGVAAHPQIANVVVVGSDDVVPMARAVDTTRSGNESQYADAFDPGSPIGAAFATSHFLTDAAYGDLDPIPWLNRRLYVEDLAVGRLVETPAQMTEVIDTYLTSGGVLDPSKALVTGYDWMKPGATAVKSTLATKLTTANGDDPVTPVELINDTWTSANLLTGAGSIAATQARVTNLFMHADHLSGVSAQGSADGADLFTPAELAAALPAGTNLVFSMGCHAGLSDARGGADFPEQLLARGAVYLAATGFGYGDDSGVQLHDRLIGFFAGELDGAVTIGDALVRAKQTYFSTQGLYGTYDDKVLESMNLYGLPFFRVGGAAVTRPAPTDVTPTAGTGGVSSASFVYDQANPGAAAIPMSGALTQRTGPDGAWYEVAGQLPLTLPGRPTQPRVDRDVTARTNGQLLPAHGALITALTDAGNPLTGFDAAWARATVDDAATAPEIVAGDVAFPARFATISTYSDPSGAPFATNGPKQRQRIVLTPGRFESNGSRDTAGTGTQELFSRVEGSVLYSASGDFTEPTILGVDARVNGTTRVATFDVDAADGAGIGRVVVLFRDSTGWRRVDLTAGAGTRWTGTATVASSATTTPYYVQVVDVNGNVGVASNKGSLFPAVVRPTVTVGDITIAEPATGTANASFPVTLSAATSVPVTVAYRTADASATALSDFLPVAGRLTFAPGETTKVVEVPVLADTEREFTESFGLVVDSATNADLAKPLGTATIPGLARVSVNVGDSSVGEGDSKNGSLRFRVTLTAAQTSNVVVTYSTRTVTASTGVVPASPGSDFKAATNASVTIPAGSLAATVEVNVTPDLTAESDERMELVLTKATVVPLGRSVGTGVILNDDGITMVQPRITIGDAKIVEGNTGTRNVELLVRLSGPQSKAVSVNYTTRTVAGGATEAARAGATGDYVKTSGTLKFEAASYWKVLSIPIQPDTANEADETFQVVLTGTGVLRSVGTVTILNDD
ncbi:MAG: Calx-beta domain-containing protein [Actinomycetes bacterium]